MKVNKKYKGTLGALTSKQANTFLSMCVSRNRMRDICKKMGISQKPLVSELASHIANTDAETRSLIKISAY